MIVRAFLLLVAIVVVVGIFDWRKGALLCLPIGFLQDAVRKVAAGQSVVWLTTVVGCIAACYLGVVLRDRRLGATGLLAYYQRLRAPLMVFLFLVTVQAGLALVKTGEPIIAGIGLLFYLSPLFLLILGVRYSSDLAAWRRWGLVYLAVVAVVAGSVGLQFAGLRSPLLTSIGVDVTFGAGGAVHMMSGLMRSSEVAAWHLAMAFCLCVLGLVLARRVWQRFAATALASGFFVALVLTGRRKMLGEIALFLLLFALLLVGHRRGFSQILRSVVVLIPAAALGAQLLFGSLQGGFAPYVERGVSVITESGQRLEKFVSVQAIANVLSRNGFFGSGVGTASQGSGYFGGGSRLVGGTAEGGFGKLLAELGVPGLLVLLWLGLSFAVTVMAIGRGVRRLPRRLAVPTYALIAYLAANFAVFLTAHQVYGDPFVLILLGWLAGFLLAVPRVARAEGFVRVREPVGVEEAELGPTPHSAVAYS